MIADADRSGCDASHVTTKIMEVGRGWRAAHQLNRKAEVQLVLLIVDFDGFKKFEKPRSRIPRHPRAGFGDVITFQGGYWNAINCRSAEAIYEIRKILPNFLVAFPAVIHQVHLVDCDNEMADAQKMRDERVTPRLRHDSVPCIDQDDRQITVTGAGDKISRVLLVSGRIRDDELSFGRGEVPIRNVDRDALLALGAQTVGQQREIDAFAAAPFVFPFRAFDLVFKCALSFDE